ncbi:MAG: hypothetical protein ACTSW1_02500 [Candidatus Hodarchaeales archaeon]
MKEKWRITPKKIGRSRKIQVRQFEPEEIYIEFELDVSDDSSMHEAIQEATKLAIAYLDEEEEKLRGLTHKERKEEEKPPTPREYTLEITEEGKKLGNFQVKASDDPQYTNFLHLWLEKGTEKIYVGYLLKDSGDFKFKSKNKDIIKKLGIKKGLHFEVKEIQE